MKCTVKSHTIQHNGKIYPSGSTIELESDEIQSLRRFIEAGDAEEELEVGLDEEPKDEETVEPEVKSQSNRNQRRR